MHKHSKSVVLALFLMSYKCVREAPTEVYLSEAINILNRTTPLLKRIIDDDAVGRNPAHFDLLLARKEHASGQASSDWLVYRLQELISLAYQISTIQFENMQPVGVALLGTIVDKARLVSAVRTTLDTSSSPSLLEACLHLATKILTSGIVSGDQVVVRRIFSLISRPLNDFEDIYYPSFAEWVTSKIKIRLLAAHASLKCYIYASMRKHQDGVPDDYLALLPLFQKSSSVLGKYWIHTLKDYSYMCLCLNPKRKVAQNCPQEFFITGSFALTAMELCLHYLFKVFQSIDTISVSHPNSEVNVIHTLCSTTKAVINRIETKVCPLCMILDEAALDDSIKRHI